MQEYTEIKFFTKSGDEVVRDQIDCRELVAWRTDF